MANKYIKPSGQGGDYTSLSAWEAQNRDLVTAQDIENAIIDGDWSGGADTAAVVIEGWITSSTYYINIYTTSAARHAGKWNTSKYRLQVSSAKALRITDKVVYLDGLQIYNTLSPDPDASLLINGSIANSLYRISNSILRCTLGYGLWGIPTGSGTIFYIWNNIIYDVAGRGIVPENFTYYIYSNTVIGGGRGIIGFDATITAKNNYAKGSDAAYSNFGGSLTLTTCASADDTGSVGLRNIAVNTTNFTNVTGGSEDFHLPSGSALIDVGTNTSGEGAPLNFTTDIDGQSRSGTWDVGADEYVAVGEIKVSGIIPAKVSGVASPGKVSGV